MQSVSPYIMRMLPPLFKKSTDFIRVKTNIVGKMGKNRVTVSAVGIARN